MICNKTFNGLQAGRVYNRLVEIGDGSCVAADEFEAYFNMEVAIIADGGVSFSDSAMSKSFKG